MVENINRREALAIIGGLATSAIIGAEKKIDLHTNNLRIIYACNGKGWFKNINLNNDPMTIHDDIWCGLWLDGNTQGVYNYAEYNKKLYSFSIDYVTSKEWEFECPLPNKRYTLQINRFWHQIYDHEKKYVYIGIGTSIPCGYEGHGWLNCRCEYYGRVIYVGN